MSISPCPVRLCEAAISGGAKQPERVCHKAPEGRESAPNEHEEPVERPCRQPADTMLSVVRAQAGFWIRREENCNGHERRRESLHCPLREGRIRRRRPKVLVRRRG